MPNMTIAVQNALPLAHRGVGTATLAFFRSLGGLIGVTGAGAILARQVHMAAGSPGALSEGGLPHLATWSFEAQAAAIPIYRHAIATTFTVGACIVAIALVAVLFLPELPLRAHRGAADRPSDVS
jgi:hypothetical protein